MNAVWIVVAVLGVASLWQLDRARIFRRRADALDAIRDEVRAIVRDLEGRR